MLVLKNAVTRPYWEPMYKYLITEVARRAPVRITPKVKQFQKFKNQQFLFVEKEELPVSWMYLTRRSGWQAWEVTQIWTMPDWRGKGFAEAMYKVAVNDMGLILASGNLHTQFSQEVWKKFIRKNVFNIWAQDFRDLSKTSTVLIDEDGELECDLTIYSKPSAVENLRSDVRFLAIKRT